MALNIEAMRAKLEASRNGGKKQQDNTKWRPSEGDQTIRVLPTNDGDPFKEYYFHYGVGKNPGILCPKRNHGEDCPICEFASKLWREGVESSDDTAKREARKLFAKKRYFSPIIVRGEESKGVRIWSYGKMAYETLLSYVLDPDYGDITHQETGTDIVLNYSVPGTPGSFPKTSLKPRRRPSVLCDDDVADCDELLNSVPEIETLFQRQSTSEVQALLDEYLSSDESSESLSSETERYNSAKTVDDALKAFMNKDSNEIPF